MIGLGLGSMGSVAGAALPLLKKYWLHLVIAGAAVYGYKKYFVDSKDPIKSGNGVDFDNFNPLPAPAPNEYVISDQDAAIYANKLFDAMKNSFHTDELAIYSVMHQIGTKSNYYKVRQMFGKKPYDPITGSSIFLSINKLGLDDWLKAELSSYEYDKLKSIIPLTFY